MRTCGNFGFLSQVNPNIREIRSSSLLSGSRQGFLQNTTENATSKATGEDGLGFQLLKIAASGIAEPISRLINLSISTRNFSSSKWKIAKVTPVFKNQGSKNDKQNYRPISFFPILSKIFERHM